MNPAPKFTDASVDIETLSLKPNAVILSIAAVAFDPRASMQTHEEVKNGAGNDSVFFARPNIDQQLARGHEISSSTLQWWSKPALSRARRFTFEDTLVATQSMPVVLRSFCHWCAKLGITTLWADPAAFDLGCLRFAFMNWDVPAPVSHRNMLDGATLRWLTGEERSPAPFIGTEHHAVDDAIHQAREIQCYYTQLDLDSPSPE